VSWGPGDVVQGSVLCVQKDNYGDNAKCPVHITEVRNAAEISRPTNGDREWA
jgi:hypothetical protein